MQIRRRRPEVIKELTGGRGADVTIEFTGSYRAPHEAIRAAAYGSRVAGCGFLQGVAGIFLGKEFDHSRIELFRSHISGVASVGPPLEAKPSRMHSVCTTDEGRLDLELLISHVVPVEEAADTHRLLDERPEEAAQVVLRF